MIILITGSTGLIGSTATQYFLSIGHQVVGVDNNLRKKLFGLGGDTTWIKNQLIRNHNYVHYNTNINNIKRIQSIFKHYKFDAIIHCAAQPSHDKAKTIPLLDFQINTFGTLNFLELTKQFAPKAVFIFTSTNKVYGDNPNQIPIKETKTKFEFKDKNYQGIDETMSIDQNTHSLFGVSKTAADLYVQEYGRYFGLKTTCLRLGCVSGQTQSGVKLHGFLSYLIKSLKDKNSYEIIGYKGKQVRDQIHARDLAKAFEHIIKKPNRSEVFNLGGGKDNSLSVLEAIDLATQKLKIKPHITYKKTPRVGDHICYITNNNKFKTRYPEWKIEYSLENIIDELIARN